MKQENNELPWILPWMIQTVFVSENSKYANHSSVDASTVESKLSIKYILNGDIN